MPPPRASSSSTGDNGSTGPSGRSSAQPLVIVSEGGRHSEASRRIVRAQAARASAAQSRETRARNREDRHQREGPQSPADETPTSARQPEQSSGPQSLIRRISSRLSLAQDAAALVIASSRQPEPEGESEDEGAIKPLLNWITNVLHLSARSFAVGAAVLASTGVPQLSNASDVLSRAGGILDDRGDVMAEVHVNGGTFNRRLPIALPKGFAMLQQKIDISDAFLVLLSRTACFDFGSPGVEDRLNELLFDIVMTTATSTLASASSSGHPIQGHLRIACTCLTIFQGQRADGQSFAHDQKYNTGLEAAWAEAVVLDQEALKEPKSAEAALWAIFIISVTCNATVTVFHQLISGLLQDLQLQYWDQVRTVLLEFIYPGSFLDEPCRQFFDRIRSGQQVGQAPTT